MNKPPFWPVCIGTGFGAGFSPVAPGTSGALLAVLIWMALYHLFPFVLVGWITLAFIVIFTLMGVWAANRLEPFWGEDPSRVVIDEMVGVWIPILAVPDTTAWGRYLLGAFVLFRFFDIVKPLGIRRMERLKGGWGVMMDDVLAGVYSLLLLLIIRCWIG